MEEDEPEDEGGHDRDDDADVKPRAVKDLWQTGGIDDRIESTMPPDFRPKVVPLSYNRLNST